MKTYKVLLTEDAEKDLDNFVYYLLVEKMNPEAATALLDDYDETIEELSKVAGSLAVLDDPDLSVYRKIHLRRHRYYFLYRLQNDTAVIDRMFHALQDIDNVIK